MQSTDRNYNQQDKIIPESMLYDLTKMKNFRDSIPDVTDQLDLGTIDAKKDSSYLYQFAYIYIDSLFGYKTKDTE